jgi:hypothetical protein
MTIRFRGRCRLGVGGGRMAYHTQGRYRRRMGRGRIMASVGAISPIQHCRPMCVVCWGCDGVDVWLHWGRLVSGVGAPHLLSFVFMCIPLVHQIGFVLVTIMILCYR